MKRRERAETTAPDRFPPNGDAPKDPGRSDDREMGCWLHNRAEKSQLPPRRLERAMLRFRHMPRVQKLAAVPALVRSHFPTERHLQNRNAHKMTSATLTEQRRMEDFDGAASDRLVLQAQDSLGESNGSVVSVTNGWLEIYVVPNPVLFGG